MRAIRPTVLVFCLALPLFAACASRKSPRSTAAAGLSSAEVFAELKALVGPWEGLTESGRTSRVAYRVSAGESVLVETWTQSRGREALTIYHLDGDGLLATHYCPKGNQVRLRWTGGSASKGMSFRFLDGTNLDVPEQSHQRAVWLKILDAGSFERGETYVANGSSKQEIEATVAGAVVTYHRAEAPQAAD